MHQAVRVLLFHLSDVVAAALVGPSQHVGDDVDGHREHDRAVLLRGDVVQRLQVAQLQKHKSAR